MDANALAHETPVPNCGTCAAPAAETCRGRDAESGMAVRLRDGWGDCADARVRAIERDGLRLCCTDEAARRLLVAAPGTEPLVHAQFDLPLRQGPARVSVGLRLGEAQRGADGAWELAGEFLALRPRARRLFAAYFAGRGLRRPGWE